MNKLTRTLFPEVRIVDAKKGLVDYVASNETIDCYQEVIRADGWRFTNFQKNSPFVDSHNYGCIDRLLGRVVNFAVQNGQLIERVQWAIDVPENELAQIGWKMTEAGYLKAVSVGFYPIESVSRWDNSPDAYNQQLSVLGLSPDSGVRTIYLEQEQIELSACIIGANPDALAKAYKGGALSEEDLQTFSKEYARVKTASTTDDPAGVAKARQQARTAFLLSLQNCL